METSKYEKKRGRVKKKVSSHFIHFFSSPSASSLVARQRGRVFHEYLMSRRMDRPVMNGPTLDDWKRLNGKTFDAKFSLEY